MARRPLTDSEQAAARRLKAIFLLKKKDLDLTQQKAATALGWSAAAVVNQYLNGAIPLNLEAGLKFARLLRVAPSEINPEWSLYDIASTRDGSDPLQERRERLREKFETLDQDELELLDQILDRVVSKKDGV